MAKECNFVDKASLRLLPIKHRCGFCRKVLREDGTCANPQCPRYVPETTKKKGK